MSSWFTTKKVEGPATLSEKLVQIRIEKNAGLDALSDKTKISKKYLQYLEEGRLDKLPPEIYTKGFLKKIADFYGIDVNIFLKLYKKEECIRQNIDKSQYPPFNLYRSPAFIITPRTIAALAIVLALISFFVFFGFQISAIFKGPELIINEPPDELMVDYTPIAIKGFVGDKDAVVLVNNEAISLKDGKISEEINLAPGLNIIKISATNRFKKSSEVIKKVVFKIKDGEINETGSQ